VRLFRAAFFSGESDAKHTDGAQEETDRSTSLAPLYINDPLSADTDLLG